MAVAGRPKLTIYIRQKTLQRVEEKAEETGMTKNEVISNLVEQVYGEIINWGERAKNG